MFNQRRDGRRNLQPSPVLIGLLIQLASQLERSPYKPPVTILLLFLNIFVHLTPYPNVLGYDLSNIQQNCLYPSKIVAGLLYNRELLLNRIILSSIIHADDMHLYYNMLSLCWKGINLESQMGSAQYLQLVVFSLVVSHVFMVLIACLLDNYGMPGDISGYHSCAVGFSAVLFSLKYVWNLQASRAGVSTASVMGFLTVPLRYAAWLELVLISLITPNVSFIGHLSGILAGVLYMHGAAYLVPASVRCALRDLFGSGGVGTGGMAGNTRYTYASGTAGSGGGGDRGASAHTAQRQSPSAHGSSSSRQRVPSFDPVEIELEESRHVSVAEERAAREAEARRRRVQRFDI